MMLNSVSRFAFYLDATISIKCQSNIFLENCSSRPACSITATSFNALLRSPNKCVFDEGCNSRIDGFPFDTGS